MSLSGPVLAFDPSDDFLVFDNLEVIEYDSKQLDETFVDPQVPALVRHPDTNEPELSGVAQQVFHVRTKDLTAPPKPRDEIIRSDDSVWVVNDVALETFGVRYRITATKARTTAGAAWLRWPGNDPVLWTDHSHANWPR